MDDKKVEPNLDTGLPIEPAPQPTEHIIVSAQARSDLPEPATEPPAVARSPGQAHPSAGEAARITADASTQDQARLFGLALRVKALELGDDWAKVEPEARESWEAHYPGTWPQVSETVHQAWLEAA